MNLPRNIMNNRNIILESSGPLQDEELGKRDHRALKKRRKRSRNRPIKSKSFLCLLFFINPRSETKYIEFAYGKALLIRMLIFYALQILILTFDLFRTTLLCMFRGMPYLCNFMTPLHKYVFLPSQLIHFLLLFLTCVLLLNIFFFAYCKCFCLFPCCCCFFHLRRRTIAQKLKIWGIEFFYILLQVSMSILFYEFYLFSTADVHLRDFGLGQFTIQKSFIDLSFFLITKPRFVVSFTCSLFRFILHVFLYIIVVASGVVNPKSSQDLVYGMLLYPLFQIVLVLIFYILSRRNRKLFLFHETVNQWNKKLRREFSTSHFLAKNIIPNEYIPNLKKLIETQYTIQQRNNKNNNNSVLTHYFSHEREGIVITTDIVGFTKWADGVSSRTLIFILNRVYSLFDNITGHLHFFKCKTIGDAYVAYSGFRAENGDNSDYRRAVSLGVGMVESIHYINKLISNEDSKLFGIRVGVASGKFFCLLFGSDRKLRFDIFGSAVEKAAELEHLAENYSVNVSDEIRLRTEDFFQFPHEDRNLIKLNHEEEEKREEDDEKSLVGVEDSEFSKRRISVMLDENPFSALKLLNVATNNVLRETFSPSMPSSITSTTVTSKHVFKGGNEEYETILWNSFRRTFEEKEFMNLFAEKQGDVTSIFYSPKKRIGRKGLRKVNQLLEETKIGDDSVIQDEQVGIFGGADEKNATEVVKMMKGGGKSYNLCYPCFLFFNCFDESEFLIERFHSTGILETYGLSVLLLLQLFLVAMLKAQFGQGVGSAGGIVFEQDSLFYVLACTHILVVLIFAAHVFVLVFRCFFGERCLNCCPFGEMYPKRDKNDEFSLSSLKIAEFAAYQLYIIFTSVLARVQISKMVIEGGIAWSNTPTFFLYTLSLSMFQILDRSGLFPFKLVLSVWNIAYCTGMGIIYMQEGSFIDDNDKQGTYHTYIMLLISIFMFLCSTVVAFFFEYDSRKLFRFKKRILMFNRRIEFEKNQNESLIRSILPHETYKKLKEDVDSLSSGHGFYEEMECFVCFMSLNSRKESSLVDGDSGELEDFRGITQMLLKFDEIVERHGSYGVKTIQNKLLFTRTCSSSNDRMKAFKVLKSVVVSLEKCVLEFRSSSCAEDCVLNIGLAFGVCNAGVVGHKTVLYDIFGGVVNFASRLCEVEKVGRNYMICVSNENILGQFLEGEEELCGLVALKDSEVANLKGKGEVLCSFLSLRGGH